MTDEEKSFLIKNKDKIISFLVRKKQELTEFIFLTNNKEERDEIIGAVKALANIIKYVEQIDKKEEEKKRNSFF